MRQAKLGDFLAKRSRGIVPTSTPNETFELYSVPAFETKRPEVVTGAEIGSNKQIVEPGTVLLCKINPRINRAWTVGSFTKHKKIASTEWITFPPHADLEPRYLAHYLSRREIRDYLAANASGVGGSLMRVKASTVEDLPLPLPDLEEQRRIVAEIEKQFSRLDEAVANLKRVKANLKRYKAAVLKAAVEGTLIGGQTAANWAQVQIGQVAQVISGLTKNPRRYRLPRKLPYLRVANVYANELRLDDVEEIGVADREVEKLLLKRGDMLVVEGNGSVDQIGRVALWNGSIPNCIHQNHLIKVRFERNVLPQWALIWLLSPTGRREIEQVSSSTSGLHTLSTGKVGRLPLPLPPIREQQRIVEEVDLRMTLLREAHAATEQGLIRTERLRSSTLTAAFSVDRKVQT
jgi:type I restriction enzyme S subunit